MSKDDEIQYGVLVGWKSQPVGDGFVLTMQRVTTPPPHRSEDVKVTNFLLTRTQAAQLAHHLSEMVGQSPPKHRRGWLGRMLGG